MISLESLISGKAQLTYNHYKDAGFNFFTPLLDLCMTLEGSGDIEEDATVFIAVVTPPTNDKLSGDNKSESPGAFIVTTRRAHDRKSLEVQNIESLLTSKHSVKNIRVIYSPPKDIHAILHDASANAKVGKTERPESDKEHSAALQDLENIVTDGVKLGASDIHFYVYEDRAEAVFRIDGIFSQRTPLGRDQANSIIAAGLNTKSPDYRSVIDDNEMADVSIWLTVEIPDAQNPKKHKREKINLRTSKSVALEGAHTVMRIIRTSQEAKISIDGLGMDDDIKNMLIQATDAPTGIILVTGPTGSGKSTSLAALYEAIDDQLKIILLEDPVEYRLRRKNTVQKPVFPDKKGQNFIDHLKSALRQDPDIIGISEMRSKEVVDIVIKSALTGHLMVSTLHTNDAIGALSRLIDEGVSPKQLAERNLIRCIVAQRLIPALCSHCKVPTDVIGFKTAFTKKKQGCEHCGYSGCKGRIWVGELIMFDDQCREYIGNHDLSGLEKYLVSNGWKSMAARARMRVEHGIIDPFEAKKYVTNLFGLESTIKYPTVTFVTNEGLDVAI